MSLFFSTTPNPSSQEEGTPGSVFSSIILILTHPLLYKNYHYGKDSQNWNSHLGR